MRNNTLNRDLLKRVKLAFVPQPGGAPMDPAMGGAPADPAAMGGGDPAAMGGAPMDPAMAGGMPPPGMDPAMAGGMPPPGMDPAAMGGAPMPPPGMDPAMAGMVGGAPMPPPPMDPAMGGAPGNGNSMITMTTDEFMKFIKQLVALIKGMDSDKPQAAANVDSSTTNLTEVSAKLDALLNSLN
jgi:hypothetical protein